MEKENFVKSHNIVVKQRNFVAAVCLCLLAINLLLTILLITSEKEIVLVPNSIDQEISIKDGKMSNSYLEALTRDVTNLILNITPDNVEYSSKAILKITHPQFYGTLKTELNKRSKDVINRKISTYFAGQSIFVGDDKMSVIVLGKLSTFLGKEEVSVEEKNYAISFKYEGYRPLIMSFEEVDGKGNSIKSEGGASEKAHN